MANIKQILGFGSDTDDYEDDVEYEEEATEEKRLRSAHQGLLAIPRPRLPEKDRILFFANPTIKAQCRLLRMM